MQKSPSRHLRNDTTLTVTFFQKLGHFWAHYSGFYLLSEFGLLGNFTDSVKKNILLAVFLYIAIPPKGINYFSKENVKNNQNDILDYIKNTI